VTLPAWIAGWTPPFLVSTSCLAWQFLILASRIAGRSTALRMKVILRYPEDRTLVIVSDNRNPEAEGVADLKMEPMTVAVAFGLQRDSIKN
jgi:hypothetical protein